MIHQRKSLKVPADVLASSQTIPAFSNSIKYLLFWKKKSTLLSQQTFSTLYGKFPRVCSSLQGRWGVLWQPHLKLRRKFLMSSIWKRNSDWNSSCSVFIFSVNLEFTPALYLQFSVCVVDVSTDSTGWVEATRHSVPTLAAGSWASNPGFWNLEWWPRQMEVQMFLPKWSLVKQ